MAELILGSVALGIPIAQMAIRLKLFVDDWKDAPDDIKWTLDEIAIAASMISHVEERMDSNEDQMSQECVDLCKRALGALHLAVLDMELSVGKRRVIGRFRAVIGKKGIEKLRGRLMSAIGILRSCQMMQLSDLQYSLYKLGPILPVLSVRHLDMLEPPSPDNLSSLETRIDCQRSNNPDSISSSRDTTVTTADTENPNLPETSMDLARKDLTDEVATRLSPSLHQTQRMSKIFQLQMYSWFTRSMFTISGYGDSWRAFNVHFRAHNVVDENSQIVDLIFKDDVEGIQKLFSEGKATPYDLIAIIADRSKSWNLLMWAAMYRKVRTCKLLIEQGVECGYESLARSLSGGAAGPSSHFELIRLIANHSNMDMEDYPSNDSNFPFVVRCSPEALKWLISEHFQSFRLRSYESLLEYAHRLASLGSQPDFPAILEIILNSEHIDPTLCSFERYGRTFLLEAAYQLGTYCFGGYGLCEYKIRNLHNERKAFLELNDKTEQCRHRNWLRYISKLVIGGSNIHQLGYITGTRYRWMIQTPFLACIDGVSTECCQLKGPSQEDMEGNPNSRGLPTFQWKSSVAIRLWLEELLLAGVDLVEYGSREHATLFYDGICTDFQHTSVSNRVRCKPSQRGKLRKERTKFMRIRRVNNYRLVTFTYGPRPCDWELQLIDVGRVEYSAFRAFWDMVDHPEWAMPGAFGVDEEMGDNEELVSINVTDHGWGPALWMM